MRVIDRHNLLLTHLHVVFDEEQKAYDKVKLLMWLLPSIIFVAAVVDALFVCIYMKYLHQWKGILGSNERVEVTSVDVQNNAEVAQGTYLFKKIS